MKTKTLLKYLLRVAITVAALWLTFKSISLERVVPLLKQANIFYIFAAFICLHLAQFFSAFRMRVYLVMDNILLPVKVALNLQYASNLFTAFLPGGAGGDAYKTWWLKRYMKGSLKDMALQAFSNRLNGLWSLGVITCTMAIFSTEARALVPYASLLLIATILAGTIAYHILARYLLKEKLSYQYRAGVYSYLLQALLVGAAYFIFKAVMPETDPLGYLIIFMLSCIVAMLPLSIGGIGLRELTLLHVSPLLGLSPEKGVVLAFGFTLLNLTIPVIGAVVYFIWKPKESPIEVAAELVEA